MKPLCIALLCASGIWAQGIITTVAGTDFVFPSTGVTGATAPLSSPTSVALDGKGNLYIADPGNNMVFKLASGGSLTIVAGTGVANFSGDGGPATSAALNGPSGVAVDALGNVFIADTNNSRIRKVDSTGKISTVAGNGNPLLASPRGMAADSNGNVFIADWGNSLVRKLSPSGAITTVAGNGQTPQNSKPVDGIPATQSPLSNVVGVAVDASGNLFIAGDSSIKMVNAAGVISSIVVKAILAVPDAPPQVLCSGSATTGVAAGVGGNLFWTNVCSIAFEIDSSGTARVLAGSNTGGFRGDGGPATSASLWKPQGLVADSSGNVFIADTGNFRVREINAAGAIKTVAGNGNFQFGGDGGDARAAYLSYPRGIAPTATGELFIADTLNNRVRRVNAQGVITTIAGAGPTGFSGDGGPAAAAQLGSPYGVANDFLGNLFIADSQNSRIREVYPTGTINTILGGANGVTVSPQGNLYTGDGLHLYELTPSGVASLIAGTVSLPNGYSGDGGPAVNARINDTRGIAVDASGNVYFADSSNHRIRKIALDGTIVTIAGNGDGGFSGEGEPATTATLRSPAGVAVDGNGNVFIADSGNNRVRMVTAGGVILTVAGSDQPGFSGDGGAANQAKLNAPQGIAVDISGNLYVADSGNNRIRKITGVAAPLLPVVNQVVNAATNKPGPIAPGSLITIYGTNLESGSVQAPQGPTPLILGGTQILIGGVPAPIWYASPGELNAQVPFDLPTNALVQLTVTRDKSVSPPVQLSVAAAQPGIFVITKSDGVTLAQQPTPATIGETVVIYCTGLGAVTPPVSQGAGAPASPPSTVNGKVTVQIGGQTAAVSFAGLSPGFPGLYQVNAVVPPGIQTGNGVPVVVTEAGWSSPAALISVR